MKYPFKQVLFSILICFISVESIHAVVLELKGIITVTHEAESQAGKDIIRGTLDEDVENHPKLLLNNINASKIVTSGITYSFPVEYIIELSDDGILLQYRIDFQKPIIRLDDTNFTAEEPSIDLNTYVTIIENQSTRYVSEVNAPQKINHRFHHDLEGRESRVETTLAEYWITEFNEIVKLLSDSSFPENKVHHIENEGRNVFLSKKDRILECFIGSKDNADAYIKYEWDHYQSMIVPVYYVHREKGDTYETRMSIVREVGTNEYKSLFTIPEKNNN